MRISDWSSDVCSSDLVMAVVGEIKRLFHSGVPTTDDDDLLAAIEKSVASGASRNALALKQHLAFQTQPLGLGARRDDQRVGIILHATVTKQEEGTIGQNHLDDLVIHHPSADMLGLSLHLDRKSK